MFIHFSILSIEHIIVTFWPYISYKFNPAQLNNKLNNVSEILNQKIRIIYNNLMIGFVMGITFFHLIPLSDKQILKEFKILGIINAQNNQQKYGMLITVIVFLIVLLNSNYFYHTNSTRKVIKRQNFRNRTQFQHQILTNKKIKIRRRLAIQPLFTQILIKFPSILLISCLSVEQNQFFSLNWLLLIVLFQKYPICQYFGRSYYAAGIQSKKAFKLIIKHLFVQFIYFFICNMISSKWSVMNGVFNAISAGVLVYDVMMEKIPNNYQQKQHILKKISFCFCGVFSAFFIFNPNN